MARWAIVVSPDVPTLRIHAPGLSPAVVVDLGASPAALIGRRPVVAALDPARLPVPAKDVTLVAIPSALVSENHLLVWRDGPSVMLLDLRSTNGSRWRLPAQRAVPAHATGPIDVELGMTAVAARGGPSPAEWSSVEEFRENVTREVNRWLADEALPATASVEVASDGGAVADDVPLGDGWVLRVEDGREGASTRTEHPALRRAVEDVWAYVRAQRGEFEAERDGRHDDLVLASPLIRALHRRIWKAARHGLGGILQGESGVGKSALARCFHEHSERRAGPYVETNLGEDSDDRKFFHYKLFGARAHAWTGLTRDRDGLVHAAHKGTLFLDEVGLLPLEVQGLLLRFLDNGTFRRLGDAGTAQPERADVRVVVGTNTDLREAVRGGTFREDLWWRLSGIVVDVPPLRERREDVAAFLRAERVDLGRGPAPLDGQLTADARALLVDEYRWPGNFRELRGFTARLGLFVDGATATRAHCEQALRAGSLAPPPPNDVAPPAIPDVAWADLMARAQVLLPRWLAVRPHRGDGLRATPDFELRVFVDEVFKPLCVARALGVEAWDELPRRPDPSYQALATRIGYSDGKSVQENLRLYLELKRLM